MTENERMDALADKMGAIIFPVTILLIFSAPAIWLWQCLAWLKTGDWPALPVAAGFAWAGIDPPRFSWVGAQKIWEWVLAAPLSVTLMAVALAVLMAFITWSDEVGKKLKDERLAKKREEMFGQKQDQPHP